MTQANCSSRTNNSHTETILSPHTRTSTLHMHYTISYKHILSLQVISALHLHGNIQTSTYPHAFTWQNLVVNIYIFASRLHGKIHKHHSSNLVVNIYIFASRLHGKYTNTTTHRISTTTSLPTYHQDAISYCCRSTSRMLI